MMILYMFSRMADGVDSENWSRLVAAWALSDQYKKLVDQRCKAILGPSWFKGRELTLFAKRTHFNTKDKERFFTTWGEYVLDGLLDPQCFAFYQKLCALIRTLVSREVPTERPDQEATRITALETMVAFEDQVPDTSHTLATHTTEHAVDIQLRCGPLPKCWGWEHFQGLLTRYSICIYRHIYANIDLYRLT